MRHLLTLSLVADAATVGRPLGYTTGAWASFTELALLQSCNPPAEDGDARVRVARPAHRLPRRRARRQFPAREDQVEPTVTTITMRDTVSFFLAGCSPSYRIAERARDLLRLVIGHHHGDRRATTG
jgi:hypothetical protein